MSKRWKSYIMRLPMVKRNNNFNRVYILIGLTSFFTLCILSKLFFLQVVKGEYYADKAATSHLGYSEVNARRGEILLEDYHSNEVFRLATNTTMPLLFADPTLVKDSQYLANKFAPLIFDLDDARALDTERIREARRNLTDGATEEELKNLNAKTDDELRSEFHADLLRKLSQKTRDSIILYQNPDEKIVNFVESKKLPGISIQGDNLMVHPAEIGDREYTARVLSPLVEIPYERLDELLKGRNRYVVLRKRLPTKVELEIRKLIDDDKKSKADLYKGVSFQEQTYRYYPEGQLASQVVGFSNQAAGLYGIEQSFENELRGKKGIFKTKLDATGQQIIVGDDLIIQPAIDGADITLTIDRSIQMEVENNLKYAVESARADSGLVIVMEPKTGRIIAMAHYPTFDPNAYWKALDTEDIYSLTAEEKEGIVTVGESPNETHYLWIDPDSNYRIQVFKELTESGRLIVSKYKNLLGTGVFRNRVVQDLYEPGSVFKVIAMAIALDDGDVTPLTTFNDTGPVKVDEFEIKNATNDYFGAGTTMQTVLQKSLNTGMAFVARKMGRELFYRYLKKFGFGERTYLDFEGEVKGKIQDPSRWAESELITYAFGQGIAISPIQFITAAAALANGGILMKPQIVKKIDHRNGNLTTFEPEPIRRVVSEKTSATISAMMVSVIENGGGTRAQVKGYRVAGKTGTAQTYKHGKPLTGPGTTIASFIGFAPINDPKFIILTKIDRPRATIWADGTAAPLFGKIAEFMFKYYNIPPEV